MPRRSPVAPLDDAVRARILSGLGILFALLAVVAAVALRVLIAIDSLRI